MSSRVEVFGRKDNADPLKIESKKLKQIASGEVHAKRQDEIFILESSLNSSASLTGNEITIKGEKASIVKDSGPQFLSGRKVRGLKICPQFSFAVQQGMEFRILPSLHKEKLSWTRLFEKNEDTHNSTALITALFFGFFLRLIVDMIFGAFLLFCVVQVLYLGYARGEDVDVAGFFPEWIRPSLHRSLRVKINGSSIVQAYTHEALLFAAVVLLPLGFLGLVRFLAGLHDVRNRLYKEVAALWTHYCQLLRPKLPRAEASKAEPKERPAHAGDSL